jgi:hypothetical protein
VSQDRDYTPGEKISLGIRSNAEFIAAVHRVADRSGMSTSQWCRQALLPLLVTALKVNARVLEPGGGFDTRLPKSAGRAAPPPAAALTHEGRRLAEQAASLQAARLDADQASKRLLALMRASASGVAPAVKKRKRR